MCLCVYMDLLTCVCRLPLEIRKGHQISSNWSYRSGCWESSPGPLEEQWLLSAISPAPHCLFFRAKVVLTKACTCDSVLPTVISVQNPETFTDSPSTELSQFSPRSESHRMGLCEKLMFYDVLGYSGHKTKPFWLVLYSCIRCFSSLSP